MPRHAMNFSSLPVWRKGTLLLLVIAVLGCLQALLVRDDLLSQLDERAEKIRRLERSLNHHESSQAAVLRQNPQQAAEVRRITTELQRPWESMLNALQRAAKLDVQILRLQPDSDARRLVIGGQADSSDAFLAYVQRLRRDASWKMVEPLSEERNLAAFSAPGGKPVTFQLVAEWKAP
jgi:septal ring factor EnvC (AmiA/AmiB activator)